MSVRFAYLAEGRLFVVNDGQEPAPVESHYAQRILDREEHDKLRKGWRDSNPIWSLGKLQQPVLPNWAETGPRRVVRFASVARGGSPGSMLYVLNTENVAGLFEYDHAKDEERRLIHRSEFHVRDLDRHAADGRLVCSVAYEDGSVNLAVAEVDGRKLRAVTEGDSIDEAPAWREGSTDHIVYQSAGVGRDEHGFRTGLSPYRVERLDLANGKVETLLEDEDHDYLLPRMTADGTLYCVRRPYDPRGRHVRPWQFIIDGLLFPFRLALGIFGFLNFFAMIYGGKPLTTADGPQRAGPERKQILLWGRWIDASRAARRKGDDAPLVGQDWQLIRRDPQGGERVVASGVLSYDLTGGGGVVYTDGSRVTHLGPDGQSRVAARGRFIERVVCLA